MGRDSQVVGQRTGTLDQLCPSPKAGETGFAYFHPDNCDEAVRFPLHEMKLSDDARAVLGVQKNISFPSDPDGTSSQACTQARCNNDSSCQEPCKTWRHCA